MSTTPTPGPAPTPGDPSTEPVKEPRARGPRLSTVIWGVLVMLAAAYVLFPLALGFELDLQLAAIVALAATGFALLLAAVVSALRRR